MGNRNSIEKLKRGKISPRECYSLLESLGYRKSNKGKTSGSRVSFTHSTADSISLHNAHSKRDLMYIDECKMILKTLKKGGLV